MGCCQNSRGYLNSQNKNSSTSLNKIKETNLSSDNFKFKNSVSKKQLNKSIKIKKPEFILLKNKKNIILDKINEEDSEYKEDAAIIQQETQKNSDKNNSQKNMLRKSKSHLKFNTKLSEEIFHKKLNEYKEMNISKNSYQIQKIKESKSENNFNVINNNYNNDNNDDDTNEDIGKNSFEINKYNIFNVLKLNKDIYSPKKNKIQNLKYNRKFIKLYEEDEITANTISHTPKCVYPDGS